MRSARWVIIGTMAVAVLCAAARAEEASVLMQEGVYEEDVAGDLDKAMGVYQKIIDNAEAERRYVAEAHFRLGKCCLAKGDRAKAEAEFRVVVERYADQQKLAAAAGSELARLAPPPASRQLVLGPVTELTVGDDNAKRDMFVDLDTGRLFSPPEDLDNTDTDAVMGWVRQNHIDALGETSTGVQGLIGFDMVVRPVAPELWESATVGTVLNRKLLPDGPPGNPAPMPGKGELPVTYLLKTRERGRGILQIVGFPDDPRGVRIRYRLMLWAYRIERPAAATEPAQGLVYGPVVEQTVQERQFVDFDSGRVLERTDEDPGPGMMRIWARAKEIGADALFFRQPTGRGEEGRWCMLGLEMGRGARARADDWSTLTPDELVTGERRVPPGMGMIQVLREPPETMIVSTREGGRGLLQIVGFTDSDVTIRYRMVREATAPASASAAHLADLRIRLVEAKVEVMTAQAALDAADMERTTLELSSQAGRADAVSVACAWIALVRARARLEAAHEKVGVLSEAMDKLQAGPVSKAGAAAVVQLADLRIRLAQATADKAAGEDETYWRQFIVATLEQSAGAGVVGGGAVDQARADLARARAETEAAGQKVEILNQEIDRLAGGRAEPPG